MDRQIRILGIVLVGLFGLVFLQLNNLQVRQASALADAPGNSRHLTQELSSPRGEILASDGTVLARSSPSADVYKYQRVYPQGSLYGDLTGYFSLVYGTDGVEQYYDSYLSESPTPDLADLLAPPTARVDNVTLTIVPSLQRLAAASLAGRTGAVVALDPATGAILAMYSNPSFDPNLLASHDPATEKAAWTAGNAGTGADGGPPLLDRAYRRSYPPGSSFKVVTSSAVYDHDPALATQNFPLASQIPLPDTTNTLHNYDYEACGGMLPELLKVSCDTGFAQVGLDLGAANLASEAMAFGFDQVPPLDLPSPAASNFPPAASFAQNLPLLAYSAIGQENVAATPLQMALVAGAIADGGTIMAPHVMSSVTDSRGAVVTSYSPHPWLTATSASTATQVEALMVGVVQGGTAFNIAIPGLTLAAKTGTAEVGTSGLTDDWMVAFGPAGPGQVPSIAVATVVPDQAPSATGSSVSGPIVRAILASALQSPAPPS